MEEKNIMEFAKKHLSEIRYKHSIGVMERAEELARIYKYDISIARKVGLAHDIAKEFTKEQNMKYIKENNIEIDEIERENTELLHGKIGADIAKKVFGFSNEMCEAIKVHTTGKANMSLLDKIIFVADKTELGKKHEDSNIQYQRNLSNKDIDEAILYMLDEGIKKNINRRKIIHTDSIIARNYLIQNDK